MKSLRKSWAIAKKDMRIYYDQMLGSFVNVGHGDSGEPECLLDFRGFVRNFADTRDQAPLVEHDETAGLVPLDLPAEQAAVKGRHRLGILGQEVVPDDRAGSRRW